MKSFVLFRYMLESDSYNRHTKSS